MAVTSENSALAPSNGADRLKARGTVETRPAVKLVPCIIKISEAGLGLRKGEIRGLDPVTAERMAKMGTAEIWTPKHGKAAQDKVKAEALDELRRSDNKGLAG